MPKSAPTAAAKHRPRGNANSRGYTWAWRKYRKRFLQANPICVECQANGKVTAATVVDHIIPHRGNKRLFDDTRNHQALCKRCHDMKTKRGE